MKKDIHPNYREVLFHDISADFKLLTKSTIATSDTIEHEGKTVDYIKVWSVFMASKNSRQECYIVRNQCILPNQSETLFLVQKEMWHDLSISYRLRLIINF